MDQTGLLTTTYVRPIAADARPGVGAGIRDVDGHSVACFEIGDGPEPRPLTADDSRVVHRVIDDGQNSGLPIVGIVHGATVDATCGIEGLDGWGHVAASLARASGVVPTILVLDGPCVSGLALVVGLFDVVIATDRAVAYVSSPAAVATTTGRLVDAFDLGGAATHSSRSGVAHLRAPDLAGAMSLLTQLLDLLPLNNADAKGEALSSDPIDRSCDRLGEIVPPDPRRSYDVRRVLDEILDDGHHLELSAGFGQAIVCALGTLAGHTVGIVANQPAWLAGAIDIESSQKAARFVQWCDAFGIPLLTVVDTPGYLPGRDLEWAGMIRHGGQLAFAYAAATVPRLCVVLRKAYGGAFIVMDCKTMGNDLCVAWPSAEIAVMGAAGAVQILHARELGTLPETERDHERSRRESEYEMTHVNPHEAARRGYVDAVIDPERTREVLCRALPSLLGKRTTPPVRKHHNGPL